MAKTVRYEMVNFVERKEPRVGSELVAYSYAPTENFTQTVLSHRALQDHITQTSGQNIEGVSMNDDFYRRTVVKNTKATEDGEEVRRTSLSLARQLETKKDQEAVIRVITRNKKYSAEGSSGEKSTSPLTNVIPPYTKFFLEAVSEDRVEKAQVIETFGDFIAFFFGRRPEVYNFSGHLLNSKNHDWKNDFQEVYDNFLRGTKAVENNSTVFVQYDDVLAEGFLMNCHLEYHGTDNNSVPFSFAMLVTERAPVNQLQRLQDRKARSRFSAAEQQLLDSIQQIQDLPVPFSIMQKVLSTDGLATSDIVVFAPENNKLSPSSPVEESPVLPTATEDETEKLLNEFTSKNPISYKIP